jgi:hypothetical protein
LLGVRSVRWRSTRARRKEGGTLFRRPDRPIRCAVCFTRHRSASLGVAGIYRSRAGDKKASLYRRALAAISPARFGRRGFFCIEIWKSTPRRACRTLRRARDEGIRGIIRSSTIADGRGTSVRRSRGLLPSTRRHIYWVERHMLSANSRYVRSEPPFLFKRQGGMAYPLC